MGEYQGVFLWGELRPHPKPQNQGDNDPKSNECYWLAWRSIRIWPLTGHDPRVAFTAFMQDRLDFDESFLSKLGPITIKMIGVNIKFQNSRPGKTAIHDEATVIFETVEARDVVRSAATNLSKLGDPCGMRLEIPEPLKSDFRTLETTA